MKNIITKLALLTFIMSITACSTNTRNENTTIGAATGAVAGGLLGTLAKGSGSGWVIAGGAIVGALIGGLIGHSMDSTDTTNINTTMDKNDINTPSNWTNEKTGVWYKIIPTSGMITYKGNPNCRHYVAYAKNHHKMTKTKGIACRMDDGMWQQVK